jgi:hypothetical protein
MAFTPSIEIGLVEGEGGSVERSASLPSGLPCKKKKKITNKTIN